MTWDLELAADIIARDEGSLWIITGATEAGATWLDESLAEDAMRWAAGYVVEPRYVPAILAGASADGLEVAV